MMLFVMLLGLVVALGCAVAYVLDIKRRWDAIDLPCAPGFKPIVGHLGTFLSKRRDLGIHEALKATGGACKFLLATDIIVCVAKGPDVRLGYESENKTSLYDKFNSINFYVPSVFSARNREVWNPHNKALRQSFKPSTLRAKLESVMRPKLAVLDAMFTAKAEAGEPMDVDTVMTSLTLDFIMAAAFDMAWVNCLGEEPKSMELLRDFQSYTAYTTDVMFGVHFDTPVMRLFSEKSRDFKRLQTKFRALCCELYARAKSVEDPTSVLTAIASMSESDAISDIISLMIAGHDTTSHSLAFTLYLLASHPEWTLQVQRELDGLSPERRESPQAQDIPVLAAVIKESLRLMPVASGGTGRTAMHDVTLSNGKVVPAGTDMLMPTGPIHWSEHNFEHAGEFLPSRWLPGGSEESAPPVTESLRYIPFGHGSRGCLGRGLAEVEMRMTLVKLMHGFTFEVVEEPELVYDLTLNAEKGVWLRPTIRVPGSGGD